jgi:hypothetical protein
MPIASMSKEDHSGSRWKWMSPEPSAGWWPKYSDQSAE